MEDPRAVFQAGKDRQVLVLFEWQGTAGRHRCEGLWKDPTGNVVFTSQSEADARGPRFWVYWGLSLPDQVAVGTWVLEARIDGEPAGVHAFQIVAGAAAGAAPSRRALSVAELYQRGLADTLTLEALDASGARLPATSGFFLSPELVQTSFAGINAARSVRAVAPDGRRLETREIVAWNVREDWAFLRFTGAEGRPAMRAAQQPHVGDRGYFLDSQGGGERVIVETAFIGQSADGDLRLGALNGEASHGAPVLNEYGEVVAVLAGGGVPGASSADLVALNERGYGGSRARALPPVPVETASPRTLQELEESGLFVTRLAQSRHFVHGVLGARLLRQAAIPHVAEQRSSFSRTDRQCVVLVALDPEEKADISGHFALFDRDNHRLGGTDPVNLKLRPNKTVFQYWELPLAPLAPGLYRIDYVMGAGPAWRVFFRLAE